MSSSCKTNLFVMMPEIIPSLRDSRGFDPNEEHGQGEDVAGNEEAKLDLVAETWKEKGAKL